MDFGASFHAISCPDMVKNLRTGNFGKLRLADDQMLDITGIGDVDLKTSLGTIWTLKDVRVIPNLRRKLISVGKLDDEGFNVHFGGGQWKVIKGNLVIAKGKKQGTLYMAEIHAEGVHATTTSSSPSTLWHNQLGHMSEKGLKMLAQKRKFPDLRKVETEFCESCVLGKQKRVTFVKTGRTPKAQKLELVHSDVYGPTSVSSLGGSRYYVTFIDDSTRKVWVYFLKHKSDVFDAFKIWKSAVENETNLKVKCLKSDNGGEYISKQFIDYCVKKWIKMIKTVTGTPQQNGVAERMNRTLNERARSMRLNAGMPKTFWADAVNTAAYLINRSPSVPLGFKLPEEMWQGNETQSPRSAHSLVIGYGSEKMGYRLWDNEGRKVIRSKNVIFNENELYKDRNTKGPEVQKEYVEFESGETRKEASVDILENGDESSDSGSLGDDSSNDSEEEEATPSTPNSPDTPQVQPRRSSRATRPPNRYSASVNYILLTENGEPQCYSEAMGLKDSFQWELAMKDEMKSLEKNKTWHLTKLPSGKKALQNFRVKDEHDGTKWYKARLVVKGFQQKEGIDFNEIFSPVVNDRCRKVGQK
ncbi:putative RNA-directed DNA polymerase [Helianthus annuus]|nr:putative RNA-directed DNA polymerase [Helianthus annuus]